MSKKEIITDEMKAFINLESKPRVHEVEKHLVRRYAEAIGSKNPLYFDQEYANKNGGGLIAPPTFLRLFKTNQLEKKFPEPFSNLLDGGSSYIFYYDIFVGDRISAVSKLTNLFIKTGTMGDMLFRVTLISYTNQNEKLVATQETVKITYGKGERTFL